VPSAQPWLRDAALQARFRLVRSLVRALDRREEVGLEARGGLIRLLMTHYLFPEGELRAQMAADALDVSAAPLALESRCADSDCRRAALDLLAELASAPGPAALSECAATLQRLHYVGQNGVRVYIPRQAALNSAPSSLRAPESYVGLINGGATCYMNSVFQQVCGYYGRGSIGRSVDRSIDSRRRKKIRSIDRPIDRPKPIRSTPKSRSIDRSLTHATHTTRTKKSPTALHAAALPRHGPVDAVPGRPAQRDRPRPAADLVRAHGAHQV
jgi:hypothetical protein